MNLPVRTPTPTAASMPAGAPYDFESTARPHTLASGERQIAQEVLARVSLLCEQERDSMNGEHRQGRSFWSFLRAAAA